MLVREFVEACKEERDALLVMYSAPEGSSAVAAHLEAAGLEAAQRTTVIRAIDQVLTDAFYTMLMALAGSGSLGGVQQIYRLADEEGRLLSPTPQGDLEKLAYAFFQAER
jgi:hypothetical protein